MTRRVGRARGLVLRVAATVGVVGGFLGLTVGDAAAATGVTITSPKDSTVVYDTSTPSLTGQASVSGYICFIDLAVTATGGQPPPPTGSTRINLANQPPSSTTFSWAPQLPANGPYRLVVNVHAFSDPLCQVGESVLSANQTFGLAVKPAPPTGVTATANPDRTVKVDWKANSEPDIVSYSVFRVAKGKTCPAPVAADRIATTTTLSFTDTFGSADPGGDYCYTVEATRKGAQAGTTVDSDPSTAATATVAPSPTGATGGSGSGGSGSGIVTSGTGTEASPAAAAPGSPAGSGGSAAATGTAPRGGGGALDLGFSALLQRAERPAANKPGTPAVEPDGGFLPTLPFKKSATANGGDVTVGDDSTNALSEGGSNDRVRVLGAVAAGLLALVVVGHLLILRREVNRIPALEPMEPSAGAAGSSG